MPRQIDPEQWEQYFADLVKTRSWSTVKIDRIGLQFFWKHVLKKDWQWLDIVKAPKVRSLPDILTVAEVEKIIGATRNLRYRVFLLATYSMSLRLSKTLALQVGDIDGRPCHGQSAIVNGPIRRLAYALCGKFLLMIDRGVRIECESLVNSVDRLEWKAKDQPQQGLCRPICRRHRDRRRYLACQLYGL